MNKHGYGIIRIAAICLTMMQFGSAFGQRFAWQDTSLNLDVRVDWLIKELTLDEKLSLMVHQNPAIERVGLPAYSWWNEALHGVARAGEATVYPMPIALAASFDTLMVRSLFADVSAEARRKYREAQDTGYCGDYAGLTFFTPNINIFRDPRWGRGMETYGEDPFLTAVMGLSCVQGLQGGHTAACLKHLAVHSGPEGVRHQFDSEVEPYDLRTTYLPAFEYIIRRSNVAQVMCGYNRLNGVPCCTHRELLVDILRHEWNYDGMLVTDCWALNDTYERDTVIPRHRTHASAALAYGDAFGSEVDLECGSGLPALKQAVEYGYVSEEKLNEHLRRILRTRLSVTDAAAMPDTDQQQHVDPVDAAARSVVMLKNEGVLPLQENYRVRLEGPNVWDSLMPLGNYNGTPKHCVTIGEAFATHSSPSSNTVIYVGGLNPQLEGEELPVEKDGFYKGDRTRIELPAEQVEAIRSLHAEGNRVVLVLCTGSAIALEEVLDYCDAVLVAWYGGQEMGTALCELIYGKRDDFGRLPVTFYRSTQQLPPFESYDMNERTYRYMTEQPLFPFGYGLNYGQIMMDEIYLFKKEFEVRGSFFIENAVAPITRVVVQVYLNNPEWGEKKRLVGLASVDVHSDHSHGGYRIKLDPFWFRQFNSETGLMEEPEDGTSMTLQVGLSSDDKDLYQIPIIYHRKK